MFSQNISTALEMLQLSNTIAPNSKVHYNLCFLSVILLKTFDLRKSVKKGVTILSFKRVFNLVFSAYTKKMV